MAEGNLVGGVGVTVAAFRERKTVVCEPCIQGKHTRAPFPKESTSPPSTEPLQLVHMDVCGPMRVASKGGKRYLATYLDDYSRLSVVEPIASKSDVVATTQAVFARLELQTGKKVKAIQTDRGGEYVNKDMTAFLGKRGTVHRTTAGNAPEQNGAAERLNRDLEEKGRALLSDSGLGADLWAEALVTANYTRNRLPFSVHGRTPWEMFHGEKPSISHMRVFGAPAFMHIPKNRRQKLEPVTERAVFLGYAADSKAYRVQRVRDGRVMISRDVIVNEAQSQSSVFVELDSDTEKGSGGARGPSRVSLSTHTGLGDTSKEGSGTQPGAGDTSAEGSGIGREKRRLVQTAGRGLGTDEIDLRGASDDDVAGADQPGRRNAVRNRLLPLATETEAPLPRGRLTTPLNPKPLRKP
jgi:transposase InsO family protein